MDNKLIISPQIINTMKQNNEPWGIKDKNSCFIYGNKALNLIKGFSDSFDFEGLYDDELPWNGAEFAKEYIQHDQKVMKEEKSYISLETHGRILSLQ
nr:helix-turn-helix transcriptional regulator [Photorhabdus antumapuensis]